MLALGLFTDLTTPQQWPDRMKTNCATACHGQDTLYEGLQNRLGRAHFAAHWRDQNLGRERGRGYVGRQRPSALGGGKQRIR